MPGNTYQNLRYKIRYALQYNPFTINTLLVVLAVWAAYRLLYQPVSPGDSTASFRPFILLMGRVALWFLLALAALSLLSTLGAWLHYLWLRRRGKSRLEVSFEPAPNGRLSLQTRIAGIFRPLLGFVKGRLFYDRYGFSPRFSLLGRQLRTGSLMPAAVTGSSRLLLPDVRDYRIHGGFVFFEDMLQLISLAVPQPLSGTFYQPPRSGAETADESFPRRTEQTDVRIEQMRRVEGEYLNYKDFEAGDDVRRIVWKVYARSRELVVRMPERFEPYASHLYLYASFHAAVKAPWLGEAYLLEMLNYFKNQSWTVYDTLSRKAEWELRFVPDQPLQEDVSLPAPELVARTLTASRWQQDVPPDRYFNPRHGAVLIISSLTEPASLQALLEQCDAGTTVYLVRLTRIFRHPVALGWLQRLLFLPPKDRLSRLRTGFTFSPIRPFLKRRERQLQYILDASVVNSGLL